MIFVTVGTHEQPFNRLVEYMDNWAKKHNEKVIIQTGYSTYKPKYCEWKNLFPYQEMLEKVNEARIVITHGGPSSFIMPLQIGKIPVVVPRKKEFNEHVNNHQVDFSRQVSERQCNIILVEEIEEIENVIEQYYTIVSKMQNGLTSNNERFCDGLSKIVTDMFRGKKNE